MSSCIVPVRSVLFFHQSEQQNHTQSPSMQLSTSAIMITSKKVFVFNIQEGSMCLYLIGTCKHVTYNSL